MTPADIPWGVAIPPLVLNALAILLGWLGHSGRLRRNHLVGIRTPSTLRSLEAWRSAHAAASGWWIWGGLAGAVLAAVAPFLPGQVPATACLAASFGLWLVALSAGSLLGVRAARAS